MAEPHPVRISGQALGSTAPALDFPSPLPPSEPGAGGDRRSGATSGLAELGELTADSLDDLSTLYTLTDRLTAADSLEAALTGLLEDGAELVGARRGMVVLQHDSTPGSTVPGTTVGHGLDHSALGALETVPPAQVLEQPPGGAPRGERYQEVARQLGIGAAYALPLAGYGTVVWFYDEASVSPGSTGSTGSTGSRPSEREQRLATLYTASAARVIGKALEHERLRRTADALRRGLLPDRLPRIPGVQLAARCRSGARGGEVVGNDWYDAMALPDNALALTVGSVTGGGPDAAAAMGRLRAALRAYAVLEGEDPVAVLGDLELLLKSTEPARSATALYAYVEPKTRQLSLAGAGQCPPLLVTTYGASFVETSLSAPLGMLSCWEAPGVELRADRGDVLLMYTEGLARHCGPSLHAGQTRLRAAAADAPRDVRGDADRFCAYLLDACAPSESEDGDDIVLLAARFE